MTYIPASDEQLFALAREVCRWTDPALDDLALDVIQQAADRRAYLATGETDVTLVEEYLSDGDVRVTGTAPDGRTASCDASRLFGGARASARDAVVRRLAGRR